MFHDLPQIRNMITARQMDLIGVVVRSLHDRPSQRMLAACCDNTCLAGRPFLHKKDHIIKNLPLLFDDVPEVKTDDFASHKAWIREAPHAIAPS
jgi:hypothetical protein